VSPELRVLGGATLVLASLTAALSCLALSSAPSMPPERLGLRGKKRVLALREHAGFAQLEPTMRWFSTRLGGLVSPALKRHIDQQITRAGDVLGLLPEDVVSLSLLSAVAGLVLGLVYVLAREGAPLFAVVAPVVGLFLPYLQLSSVAQRRVRAIQKALPQVMDLMVLGLSAGLDFPGAVTQVVERAPRDDEPLVEELRLVLQEFKLGRTRKQALALLVERVPCDAVRDLVAASTQSEEQGTPLAAVLAAQASASRQRRASQAEETAAQASTSLLIPLGLLFIAVLILIVSPIVLNLSDTF
jgi:tight adherence protein C